MCGYNEHHAALTFDHIDPADKSFNLSNYNSVGWDRLIAEIHKCRVLCANCHNIHSFNEYDTQVE